MLRAAEVGNVRLHLSEFFDGVLFRSEELHERHLLVGVVLRSVVTNLLQVDVLHGRALVEERGHGSRLASPPPPEVAVVGFRYGLQLCNSVAEARADAALEAETKGGDVQCRHHCL